MSVVKHAVNLFFIISSWHIFQPHGQVLAFCYLRLMIAKVQRFLETTKDFWIFVWEMLKSMVSLLSWLIKNASHDLSFKKSLPPSHLGNVQISLTLLSVCRRLSFNKRLGEDWRCKGKAFIGIVQGFYAKVRKWRCFNRCWVFEMQNAASYVVQSWIWSYSGKIWQVCQNYLVLHPK